jgi:hypothetical protein
MEFKEENPSKDEANIVSAEIRNFVMGEPLGSVKSKAFCDMVDLYEVRQMQLDNPDDETLPLNDAATRETIRQRRNELEGYRDAVEQVSGFERRLESFFSQKLTDKPESVVKHQVSGLLTLLKEEYFRNQNANAPIPSSSPTA